MIFEQWDNPKTFDSRTDNILKIDGKVDYISTYSKDKGKNIVIFHRDAGGKVISGETEAVNQAGADYNNSLFPQRSFAAVKDRYESSEWTAEGTAEGTEKAEDGKTLKIVSKTYKVSEKKAMTKLYDRTATTNMKEVAYLDATTGLLAKVETYEEVNAKMSLVATQVYEFKYIAAPGNIFDTTGVNLKQLPKFNYDKKTRG